MSLNPFTSIENNKQLSKHYPTKKLRSRAGKTRHKRSLSNQLVDAADRFVFNWQVRSKLYLHLSAHVGNGVAIEIALDKFASSLKRQRRVSSARIVRDASRRLRDGKSLAEALENWIPHDELSIVAAAESAGNLPELLDMLVATKRQQQRVGRSYRNAAVRPVVYTTAMYGVVWAIGKYAVPSLQAGNVTANTSTSAKVLFGLGEFATGFWSILLPLVVLVFLLLTRYFMPRWTGRWRLVAERFFPFSYYRNLQGFLWFTGFVAMLRAGVPDVQILKRQAEHATPWLKERLNHYRRAMTNGSTFSKALMLQPTHWKHGFDFPNPELIDAVESFAGFPDFADKMTRHLERWSKDLEETTIERANILGFALEIVMYIAIGLLAYAMFVVQTTPGI